MDFNQKKYMDFTYDLTSIILDDYRNTYFRYQVLLLIKKHFQIDKLSFLSFSADYSTEDHYQEALLDNVTLGLSGDSLEDYYSNFYRLDPLYNTINPSHLKNETNDLFETENFKESKYYKDFYEKRGEFNMVSLGIERENKIIGVLTFIKSKEEGDFSKEDVKHLEHIRNLVSNELRKVLVYEKLILENHTIKEGNKYFPVSKVVLDQDYNVKYYNEEAKKSIYELTGTDPHGFKYFFINYLIAKGYVKGNKKEVTINFGQYIIVVSEGLLAHSHGKDVEYYTNVFFIKKPVQEPILPEKELEKMNLTPREREVLELIGEGLSNEDIAEKLVLSPLTVKTHVHRIYSKCEVNSRVELMHLLYNTND